MTLDKTYMCKALATTVLSSPVTGIVTLRTTLSAMGTHSHVGTVGPGHGAHLVTD